MNYVLLVGSVELFGEKDLLGKRRTPYDFVVQIVNTCQISPIGKTDLYYKMKTQYGLFERWLNTALHFKLIENIGDKYHATPKGRGWLEAWEKQEAFLKEED